MRIQFVVTDNDLAEIKELMKKTGIRTKQEFLNNAKALFKQSVEEKEKGFEIGYYKVGSPNPTKGLVKIIMMPALSAVKVIKQD